jgi:hypothetical protein
MCRVGLLLKPLPVFEPLPGPCNELFGILNDLYCLLISYLDKPGVVSGRPQSERIVEDLRPLLIHFVCFNELAIEEGKDSGMFRAAEFLGKEDGKGGVKDGSIGPVY